MGLPLYVARLRFIFNACEDCMCLFHSWCWFVRLSVFACFAYPLFMRLPLLQGCVSCYMCVLVACVFCFHVVGLFVLACLCVFCRRVFGSFVCACMVVLRVIVDAFAFVCCMSAFQISRVCKLHVLLLCCWFACLCLRV